MRYWIGRDNVIVHLNHTEEAAIVSTRICTIVFLQVGQIFISDREDFHVEIYILISLVLFGPCGRGEKVGNK